MPLGVSQLFPRGAMTDLSLRMQADVFRLPLPTKGEAVYFDNGKPKDRAPGLALRIRHAGSRKFVFFYRHGGRLLKLTIGDAASWTLDKARTTARDLRVQVEKGNNPSAEKETKRTASALLFSSIKDEYLAARKPNLKPRSHEQCARHLSKHWKALHKMALGSIDRATVAVLLRTIATNNGPVAADRARSNLSAMFAWAIGEGLCDANPVDGTNKASENKLRERVLTDAELAAVWKVAPDNDYGRIIRLLMLTAQRRNEVGSLQWSEIDTRTKTITLSNSRTKNSREHSVPLSKDALAILLAIPHRAGRDFLFGQGRGAFSGWSKAKSMLDAKLGDVVAHWTLHDLRRTGATRMADSGVQPHIIEAVLNHISGTRAGVAGVYNRAAYEPEKRAALDTLASYIKTARAQTAGGNVRRLKTA